MGTLRRRWLPILALAGAFALHAGGAMATVLRAMSVTELTREADLIVLGQVTNTGSRFVRGTQDAAAYTFTTIRVTEQWKGGATREVTLAEYGGEAGTHRFAIDGVPTYRRGEHVLVFLRRHPQFPGRYRTVGMSEGRFTVLLAVPGLGAQATRDRSAVSTLHGTDPPPTALPHVRSARGETRRLHELVHEIERALGALAP